MGDQSALSSSSTSDESAGTPQIVILVGFMGAGKTSVGRELAQSLEWNFQDLDDVIQSRESRTIEEIFRQRGESEFRRMERSVLADMVSEGLIPRVVALGGGAFVQPEIAALITERNIPSVFLDAPVETLFQRCLQQKLIRPLLQDVTQFRELYEKRRPLYMASTHRVDTTGKPVRRIAFEIAQMLGLPQGNSQPFAGTGDAE